MSVKFDGLEDVVGAIDGLKDINKLKKAFGKACALVERSAKQKAEKGTGDLRKSITSRVEINGEDEIIGIVYTPLEYAPYVEYGTGLFAENGDGRQDVPWCYYDEESGEFIYTSGQHPKPFLRPALDENREEIKRIIAEGMSND